MSNNIYVDLHVIQTVPPSCVNRDDTGSPKTAVYGGQVRARVSSQSWKRAMRLQFMDRFPENVGLRTKKVVGLIANRIVELEEELVNAAQVSEKKVKDPLDLAKKVLEAAGVKVKEKDGEADTGALFFISHGQIDALAHIALNHPNGNFEKEDKKVCQNALKEAPAVDIALFGRMVADDPSLNFDAAAQVAHAISTHTVHNEYDYFTAVDDCAPEDNAGAGHLGTVEYNSATLYRYATVNIRELETNLKNETAAVVRMFAEAFITSMPTGKQNTFANRTRPDAVYVAIRTDQPVNMAGAFEKPIKSGQDGYVDASVKAFVDYARETYQDFVPAPEKEFAVSSKFKDFVETMSLIELLDAIEEYINANTKEVSE